MSTRQQPYGVRYGSFLCLRPFIPDGARKLNFYFSVVIEYATSADQVCLHCSSSALLKNLNFMVMLFVKNYEDSHHSISMSHKKIHKPE